MIKEMRDGGITVFLSMVLLLILAVVGTIIESTRVNIAKAYTERSLYTAVDAIYTEYCIPLYENYHILFIEEVGYKETDFRSWLETSIKDYVDFTLGPKVWPNTMELLDIQTTQIQMESLTRAVDYNGDIFLKEVVDQMEYVTGIKALKKYSEQIECVQGVINTFENLEEKLKIKETIQSLKKNKKKLTELIDKVLIGLGDMQNKVDLLSWIIEDTSGISKASIDTADALYTKKFQSKRNTKTEYESENDYKDIVEDWKEGEDSNIAFAVEEYSKDFQVKDSLTNIEEAYLFEKYKGSHFKNYLNMDTKEIDQDTSLEYEEEYIIAGKNSDYNNINNIGTKIIFLRTIFNLCSLAGNSEKSNMAYETASLLLGATGSVPLITAAKTLILIIWAFKEALVDAGALLKGKSLPFIKKGNDFMVKYAQVFTADKTKIHNIIKEVPKRTTSKQIFGYEEYLTMFSLMLEKEKKYYRAMDLIEENMQLTYDKDFLMEKCIYGMSISAQWQVPAKFIKLNFVKKLLHRDKNYWKIYKTIEYAY
jgi:hypothetical protein